MTSSTSTSTRLDARRTGLAGGGATLLSSHAETIPDRRRATQRKPVRPTADSLKESQLAAGRGAFTLRRTSPTTQIETASLVAARAEQPVPDRSLCLQA